MEIKTADNARYQKYLRLRERKIKAGKYAEDEQGNTYLVLKVMPHQDYDCDVATVEDAIGHSTYEIPVTQLKRCVMLEELE